MASETAEFQDILAAAMQSNLREIARQMEGPEVNADPISVGEPVRVGGSAVRFTVCVPSGKCYWVTVTEAPNL